VSEIKKHPLPGGVVKKAAVKTSPGHTRGWHRKKYFLLVHAEAINDQPVLYEYLTSQAIAPAHFYFFGNFGSSPCTEKCTGRIVCKLVLPERRAHFTEALCQVFFSIIHAAGIILGCFHGVFTTEVYHKQRLISFLAIDQPSLSQVPVFRDICRTPWRENHGYFI
jgi:hypothetical protein